jgi:hypothetical protein
MTVTLTLSELVVYLGHMEAEHIIGLVQAGELPAPIMRVKPTCRLARWDKDAVDRALDALNRQPQQGTHQR